MNDAIKAIHERDYEGYIEVEVDWTDGRGWDIDFRFKGEHDSVDRWREVADDGLAAILGPAQATALIADRDRTLRED